MKFKSRLLDYVFIIFMITYAQLANAKEEKNQEQVFRAGASTSNITPFLGEGIVGGWGIPEATHIHDELHARCLAIDDGTTKLIFIVVDLVGLNKNLIEEAKKIIHKEENIPPENVVISVVHTHSATSAQGVGDKRRQWQVGEPFDDYQKFVIHRLVDAVKIALNNLEPARIGWGVGSVPEHVFVRRWVMKPGTTAYSPFGDRDVVKTNPGKGNPDLLKPASEPDPEVSFISVQSKDGRPIALLANYSLHYVGGVPRGHISADYFAIFADRIQELLKADRQDPPFVGIMTNGTSGDVNNINFAGPAEKNPPYAKMRKVAEDLAREVFRVHNTIEHHDWVPLASTKAELTLNVRKPDKEMIEGAKKVVIRPDAFESDYPHEKTYAERILYLLDWPDQIDVTLQTFRIGDLGIAMSPFETFSETGREIKNKSPFKTTFTIELANGYHGYLPTPEEHELGGYETWLSTSKVEKDASVKMVANLINMFESIK